MWFSLKGWDRARVHLVYLYGITWNRDLKIDKSSLVSLGSTILVKYILSTYCVLLLCQVLKVCAFKEVTVPCER